MVDRLHPLDANLRARGDREIRQRVTLTRHGLSAAPQRPGSSRINHGRCQNTLVALIIGAGRRVLGEFHALEYCWNLEIRTICEWCDVAMTWGCRFMYIVHCTKTNWKEIIRRKIYEHWKFTVRTLYTNHLIAFGARERHGMACCTVYDTREMSHSKT